jgi:hypothetical protein
MGEIPVSTMSENGTISKAPSCPNCGSKDIRCRVSRGVFCKRCGFDASAKEPTVEEYNGVVPPGHYVVKGYWVPARFVPPHTRPLPRTTRGTTNVH